MSPMSAIRACHGGGALVKSVNLCCQQRCLASTATAAAAMPAVALVLPKVRRNRQSHLACSSTSSVHNTQRSVGWKQQVGRAFSTDGGLPDDTIYLPMPKLSPSMVRVSLGGERTGKVTKWLKAEGDEIKEYDAVLELSTDTLYAPGDAPTDGPIDMIVELAEAGYVGKLLVKEGETVEVGQAVMIMCEEEENIEIVGTARSPGVDLYSKGFRIATFQGYLNGTTPKD